MMYRLWMALAAIAASGAGAQAPTAQPDLGPRLERFTYPWPVQTMTVDVVGQPAEMAFMDLAPARPNGRSVVLLHGKNFCGATWESSARALSAAGYRVLVPDQIGFCKSSKPRAAQYSFEMLASFTRRLMESRGIARAHVVGHSMGGMLAMRFAIMYPGQVERLVLVNPLGLKDRSEMGLPYVDVDTLWAGERKTSYASIKAYQLENYYHGQWKPAYDRWVWMQAGMYAGAGREQVALAQAKTSEMIKTQSVAHELYRITPPTTLIVGTLDKTAFGRAQTPPDLRRFLQAIPIVAPAAARAMPKATLVRLEGLGHSPQVEDPARFERTLLATLAPPRG
ncbi:alpha/beta fold hydrolase [Sphingomonas rubra]|uniref:Pimeloyl-ACP methyl ester carboxylesterase n=1 Tax=Sphingomonas rubra TaxID=634430 RepID=A0A1I5QQQ7_9SPHN|nr:alpha/beta hydrolase [Sphingomonas rubra]SFP48470.1 Pimeloyl-ACP methyl ester carboxylesterase [Sphingomonas rubra]